MKIKWRVLNSQRNFQCGIEYQYKKSIKPKDQK